MGPHRPPGAPVVSKSRRISVVRGGAAIDRAPCGPHILIRKGGSATVNGMKRTILALACVGFAEAGLAACSDDHDHGTSSSSGTVATDAKDVIYDGATDEALLELLGAKVVPGKASKSILPAAGQKLPSAGAIPTFAWDAPAQAFLPSQLLAPPRATTRSALAQLFSFEGVASAHGTPTNGLAYFLVFGTASNARLVRVFTVKNTYQPTADVWARLTGAKAPINLVITAAVFQDNLVAKDGGPFASPAVTFTVEP